MHRIQSRMPAFECPECGGGFPTAAHDDACPWCGEPMDGRENRIGAPIDPVQPARPFAGGSTGQPTDLRRGVGDGDIDPDDYLGTWMGDTRGVPDSTAGTQPVPLEQRLRQTQGGDSA